jgi:hypothetical protein
MPKSKSHKKKRQPKRVLALPDLEHARAVVLNSLTSASAQRTYDHAIREFVAWYCSEPGRESNERDQHRGRNRRRYAPLSEESFGVFRRHSCGS